MDLLPIRAKSNLFVSEITIILECIMNASYFVERVAQGLLAVTIVFALGLVFQLSMLYG